MQSTEPDLLEMQKLRSVKMKGTYHPTTLMMLSPAGFVITWVEAVPVVIDVTMVDSGMVITGNP